MRYDDLAKLLHKEYKYEPERISGSTFIFRRAGRGCLPVATYGGSMVSPEVVKDVLKVAKMNDDEYSEHIRRKGIVTHKNVLDQNDCVPVSECKQKIFVHKPTEVQLAVVTEAEMRESVKRQNEAALKAKTNEDAFKSELTRLSKVCPGILCSDIEFQETIMWQFTSDDWNYLMSGQ